MTLVVGSENRKRGLKHYWTERRASVLLYLPHTPIRVWVGLWIILLLLLLLHPIKTHLITALASHGTTTVAASAFSPMQEFPCWHEAHLIVMYPYIKFQIKMMTAAWWAPLAVGHSPRVPTTITLFLPVAKFKITWAFYGLNYLVFHDDKNGEHDCSRANSKPSSTAGCETSRRTGFQFKQSSKPRWACSRDHNFMHDDRNSGHPDADLYQSAPRPKPSLRRL